MKAIQVSVAAAQDKARAKVCMRARVRVMIEDGASDEDVRGWFEDWYGEFVLFRPKADGVTGWLLWGGPFLLLLVGALIGIRIARARKAPAEPVAPEEV